MSYDVLLATRFEHDKINFRNNSIYILNLIKLWDQITWQCLYHEMLFWKKRNKMLITEPFTILLLLFNFWTIYIKAGYFANRLPKLLNVIFKCKAVYRRFFKQTNQKNISGSKMSFRYFRLKKETIENDRN